MTEQLENKKTTLVDNNDDERFLLTSKFAINNVLLNLAKRPEIITAYFNHGKEYILTAVLAVMPERDLLVLDYGPDEKQNQRMLDYGRVICVTKHDSVSIKFNCNILKRAKLQDRQAFAASIPDSLFRQQRREFFRVTMPQVHPFKCHINIPDQAEIILAISDISVGGLCLIEPTEQFNPAPGTLLPNCHIELPDMGTLVFDLVVRSNFMTIQNDGARVRRVGCAFHKLPMDKNAVIQRFLHRLQIDQIAKNQE